MKPLFIFILVAGLFWSCSFRLRQSYDAINSVVASDTLSVSAISMVQLIQPYREKIHQLMDEPIGYSNYAYIHFNGQSPMGKFVLRLIHEKAEKDHATIDNCPFFTLLNAGGIRSDLTQGVITKGMIYSLLPFDNTLVFGRFIKDKIGLLDSLKSFKPNLLITGDTNVFQTQNYPLECPHFWVASSNFIAQGGDKVTLFRDADTLIDYPENFREILMQQIRLTDSLQKK